MAGFGEFGFGNGGGGGAGGGVFDSDINVVLSGGKTLGKYVNGDTIPSTGLTSEEVMNLIATEYLVPAFSSFTFNQSSPIEVGVTISGIKTFTWGTSNSSNVQPNSIEITDVTNARLLGTGLSNDGSEALDLLGAIQKNSEQSNLWQIELTNTLSGTATRNKTISWSFIQFYGASSATPTNSAQVRSLPSSRFNTSGNNFTLNTGTVELQYYVAVPLGRTITSVIDLDALNADITSEYVDRGTVSVNVDGGTGAVQTYTLYGMIQAVPYSSNHRHSITLN